MVHKKKEMPWVDRQLTCKEREIGQPKPITKWYNKKQKEKWVDKVVSNATDISTIICKIFFRISLDKIIIYYYFAYSDQT